jgi:transposase, IS5 family
MRKTKSKGLFDEQFREQKLGTMRDPLVTLNQIIHWEDFRPIIDTSFPVIDPTKGGRPPYDRVMMFKVLILQRIYNLSDEATEFQILDRRSFSKFLGLELWHDVPDSNTIANYRAQLTFQDTFNRIFELLDEKLAHAGFILNNGRIVDARIVQVPKQRNTRDENARLKNGEIPEEWKENPNKLYQKDTDATWTKKHNKTFFGYKNHIKIDSESKLITKFVTTTASVHDSEALDDLLDPEDKGKVIHADSAYSGEPCKKIIRKCRMKNKVHRKAYRNRPLTEYQKKQNRQKSSVRARVEHVFGHIWTNLEGGSFIRYIGIERVAGAIELTNIIYNLQRACFLRQYHPEFVKL